MKKRTVLVLLLTTLVVLTASAFFLIQRKSKPFREEIYPKLEEFNLELDLYIVWGCIFNHTDTEYVCLNPKSKTFEEVPFAKYYRDIEKVPEGFVLVRPNEKEIEVLDDLYVDYVYDRWFQQISNDMFFDEVDDGTHIGLYTYVPWELLNIKYRDKSTQDLQESLAKLKAGEYITHSPISDDDMKLLCELEEFSCENQDNYSETTYSISNNFKLEDYSKIDIFTSDHLPKLYFLSMGLRSLGNETDTNYEKRVEMYTDFESKINQEYNLDRDEIIFISEYLHPDFIDYWEVIYKGWSSNELKDDYTLIIYRYCIKDEACIKNKVNILMDYYEN